MRVSRLYKAKSADPIGVSQPHEERAQAMYAYTYEPIDKGDIEHHASERG